MPTKQPLTVIGFLAVTCLFSIANDGRAASITMPGIAQNRETHSAAILEQIIRQAELLAGDGQPYSFFGASVAVSGNTAVVGAPGYNDDFGNYVPGYAYVFVKPASGWVNMVQTAELKASDSGNAAGNSFGQSVAIAGDTIVVGCEGLSQAYVYMKPAGGWVNMTETAILSPGSPTFSGFGYAIAMDAAADTIVVGAYGAYINGVPQGAAYVYLKPPGGWQTTSVVNALLTASDGQQNDLLGVSVAMDRNTIVLGASGKPYPFAPGAVYVYVKLETGWASTTQNAELTASVKGVGRKPWLVGRDCWEHDRRRGAWGLGITTRGKRFCVRRTGGWVDQHDGDSANHGWKYGRGWARLVGRDHRRWVGCRGSI